MMINFLSGDRKLIKQRIQQIADEANMEIQFSKNIIADTNRQYGLFYKPKVLYCLYDSDVDYSKIYSKTPIIVIIETKIDKRSNFYKQYGKSIELLGDNKDITLDDKINNFFNERKTIINVNESEIVSFLYKLFYDFKRPYYREQAGECINLVLTGQVKTNDIKQLFILKVLDK